ncbi:hypothetical protein ABFS82_10G052500 [Erythranthe guttata]
MKMINKDSDFITKGDAEGHSPLRSSQRVQHTSNTSPSLGRQSSSIYSLTLDEFQHTLCDSGKNFGSMNMDEFLNSIFTAEENQENHTMMTQQQLIPQQGGHEKKTPLKAGPALTRQGSLEVPEPLSRKTVDQVWSEIHKTTHPHRSESHARVGNHSSSQRRTTFGEMTLEDFLVRAGVVRGQNVSPPFAAPPPPPPQQPMYPVGPSFGARPITAVGPGCVDVASYQTLAQVDSGNQFGLDNLRGGGRKRIIDGPVEKVVERRQRRMIKNRESAARSRARKQAYTVELEAELNQLKEENAQLKQAMAEFERKRRQQLCEEVKVETKVKSKAQMAKEKLKGMRRSSSCSY